MIIVMIIIIITNVIIVIIIIIVYISFLPFLKSFREPSPVSANAGSTRHIILTGQDRTERRAAWLGGTDLLAYRAYEMGGGSRIRNDPPEALKKRKEGYIYIYIYIYISRKSQVPQ